MRERQRVSDFARCLRNRDVDCAQPVRVQGVEDQVLEDGRVVVLLRMRRRGWPFGSVIAWSKHCSGWLSGAANAPTMCGAISDSTDTMRA